MRSRTHPSKRSWSCPPHRWAKTEIINNVIGFHIHQDPAPILLVQPTIEMAETWSKDRLAPMLRDTPVLRGLVKDPRSRDSGNTLRQKQFPGGQIAMAGANSAASLASRPVRLVLLDEVDRYPPSAGTEGDPGEARDQAIDDLLEPQGDPHLDPDDEGCLADRGRLGGVATSGYTRCPARSAAAIQALAWGQVKWEKDDEGNPVGVRYECEHCRAQLTEPDKHRMIRNGRWVTTRPWIERTAGFHINELYSPWSTWESIVENFLEAKKRPETLRVWVNTSLGETWEEEGVTVDDAALGGRREDYGIGDPLPEGILLLTAGVDVQGDRIEATAWGFGLGEESWVVQHSVFRGNPETSLQVWRDLDDWLLKTWPHESGQHAADRIGLRGLRRPRHAAGVRLLQKAGVAAHLGDHRAVRGRAAAAQDSPRGAPGRRWSWESSGRTRPRGCSSPGWGCRSSAPGTSIFRGTWTTSGSSS